MNLIARAKDVLLTPRSTWTTIAGEGTNTATLYRQYVAPLAAIPAVAGFVGSSLIGVGAFGVSMRVPVATGLVQMLLGYGMSLTLVYAVALIANALTPSFGGEQHAMNALKLVAYGSTAAMLGGIFAAIPALSILMLAAALYSLYLLFLGGPQLMHIPNEKALSYTAVLAICAITLGAMVGMLLGALGGGKSTITSPAQISLDNPRGMVVVDTAKFDAWGKQMEVLREKLQQALQSGDQTAVEKILDEMDELQKEQPLAR